MIEHRGKNNIVARIITDSIYNGHRMTTFELEYNRWILAEVNTHRVISKNSASSRAVPFEKMTEMIDAAPAMPVHWGKNQAGMTAKEELSDNDISVAKTSWISAKNAVMTFSKHLYSMNLHKQVINRLLEPWSMMKTVASGTDWGNLLYLRDDEDAQPEFRELAICIRKCLEDSVPTELKVSEWHLPYVTTTRIDGVIKYLDSTGSGLELEEAKKISASCCAQVSYRRLNETKEKALEIFGKLFSGRKPHMSPTEHQATPIKKRLSVNEIFDFSTWEDGITHVDRNCVLHSGNLSGWIQYRQTLPNNVYV